MRQKVCTDYHITSGMLGAWVRDQDKIRAGFTSKKTRLLKRGGVRPLRFPRAEAELAIRFNERRRRGRRVSERWLYATMQLLVREMYPTATFVASRGWLTRCCHRLGIAVRAKSNCKRAAARDRIPAVRQWLARYRLMLKTPLSKSMPMDPIWGRFPPELRFNCDQVLGREGPRGGGGGSRTRCHVFDPWIAC
jgi:hypothetical protein